MGPGLSKKGWYMRIRRSLFKLRREVTDRGGTAMVANQELTGTLDGHSFRVFYCMVGPASNGESMAYAAYEIDGNPINNKAYDCRNLFDWIEEAKKKVAMVYDTDLKKPACPLLQAALGGNSHAVYTYFDPEDWLVMPTPGMKLIAGTHEEWLKAAEITKNRGRGGINEKG